MRGESIRTSDPCSIRERRKGEQWAGAQQSAISTQYSASAKTPGIRGSFSTDHWISGLTAPWLIADSFLRYPVACGV